MMLAAIDAGSNTLRLLIGEVVSGRVVPTLYLRRICRLAGGLTREKGLSQSAKERTLLVFKEFAEACKQREVSQIMAVGTAAFRESINGEEFAHDVREITRLPLEVISGRLEAEYMVSGVLSALNPMPDQSLIVDIGGGSTEFVLCSQEKVIWSRSIPLGVVRLIEEYTSPKRRYQFIDQLITPLINELIEIHKSSEISFEKLQLVGTAGTVTTLAALDMQMVKYDWQRVNNYSLPLSRLQQWQTRLVPLCTEEREALPGMEAGRGDLIIAGLEILICLMLKMKMKCLTVSDFGILEGLLIALHDRHKT